MQYRIADLCVSYDAKYTLLQTRSQKYEIQMDRPSLPLTVTEQEIEAFRLRAPLLDDENLEYMLVGSRFYENLLMFKGMLLHSSAVVVDNEAYLFSAPSGTGKSTHTGLWLKYFGDRAYILNDDKPAIRVLADGCYAYGTPFSGKFDISCNAKVPLKGIAVVERATENSIERLPQRDGVFALLNQTIRPSNLALYKKMLETVDELVKQVPIYKLHCNMEMNAVETSYNEMRKG